MKSDDEIVLLGVASSEVEAGMWADQLHQAGIKTLIRAGGPGAGAWASAATFEHQVFVRADQLADARDALDGALGPSNPYPRARRKAPRVHRTRRKIRR